MKIRIAGIPEIPKIPEILENAWLLRIAGKDGEGVELEGLNCSHKIAEVYPSSLPHHDYRCRGLPVVQYKRL